MKQEAHWLRQWVVHVVLQERDSEKLPVWKCPKCGREFKKKEQSHYCGEKPKTIDEYIQSQDADKQEDLLYIRQILHNALPEAEERISWSMPTYWKGHNIWKRVQRISNRADIAHMGNVCP